jgi:hypothetical protein
VGYEDRQLTFAGAGGRGLGTPWGTLGAIAKQALEEHGYRVRVEWRSFGLNNARYVADGQAELGATMAAFALSAYRGSDDFAAEGPRDGLRVLASINFPSWVGVAARRELDLESLADIRERGLAVRIKRGNGAVFNALLDYYGLTPEVVADLGGRFLQIELDEDFLRADHVPWVRSGDFDVFIDSCYASYTPEGRHWWEASVLYDLDFLPLPEELIERLTAIDGCERGFLPNHLMRGVWEDVPTVTRPPQIIYTRDEMPEEMAYEVARILDGNHQLFRQTHIPYSYDPANVAQDVGIPLHSGAARYYREAGYLG